MGDQVNTCTNRSISKESPETAFLAIQRLTFNDVCFFVVVVIVVCTPELPHRYIFSTFSILNTS